MRKKIVGCALAVCFMLAAPARGAEDQPNVNAVAAGIKTELGLSDEQVKAIKPIIKESMAKRRALLEETQGEAIIDRAALKAAMRRLRQDENKKLSEILTEEQMKKRIEKQNLRERLNPDQMNYTESSDEGVVVNMQGAAFQF